MTSEEFNARLRERAARAEVAVTDAQIAALETYFRLLARWNSTINLTALPLRDPTDETFDRLLIEPLTAVPLIENRPQMWFDLGSGGGSPAIPLKIARPALRLTMVDSKARKAAFLRDAIRLLELSDASVAETRFENLQLFGVVELMTARAVRPDADFFSVARRLIAPGGSLIVFHPRPDELISPGFRRAADVPKRVRSPSSLAVFHVEQTD